MKPEYSYSMEDIYGDACEVFVYEDGTAVLRYFDYDRGVTMIVPKDSETQAYAWAFKHGYRE